MCREGDSVWKRRFASLWTAQAGDFTGGNGLRDGQKARRFGRAGQGGTELAASCILARELDRARMGTGARAAPEPAVNSAAGICQGNSAFEREKEEASQERRRMSTSRREFLRTTAIAGATVAMEGLPAWAKPLGTPAAHASVAANTRNPTESAVEYTRGVGIYPGAPREDFSPELVATTPPIAILRCCVPPITPAATTTI